MNRARPVRIALAIAVFAAMLVGVADPVLVRANLEANGEPLSESTDGAVFLGAKDAFGLTIGFRAA